MLALAPTIALCFPLLAVPRTAPQPRQDAPTYERAALEYGAGLVLRNLPTATESTICLRFRGGRACEPDAHAGVATLTAAVLADAGDAENPGFAAWLEGRGSELLVRAEAEELRLCFAVQKDELAQALAQLVPMLRTRSIPASVLERARAATLVLEREQLAEPSRRAQVFLESLTANMEPAPLSARVRSLERLPESAVVAYLADVCRSDRLLVALEGPLRVPEFQATFAATFADLHVEGELAGDPGLGVVLRTPGQVFLSHQPAAEMSALRAWSLGPRGNDTDVPALALWSALAQSRIERAIGTADAPLRWAQVGFEPGLFRQGHFQASWIAANKAAGASLRWMLALLEESQSSWSEAELEEARTRLRNARNDSERDPHQRLLRAADLAWLELPADHDKRAEAELSALTPAALEEVLARHFDPTRLLLAAVGPSSLLEKDFALIARVVRHEPLVERLLTTLGGRAKWAATGALKVEITIDTGAGASLPTKQWLDLELPRFRIELPIPGGTKVVVLEESQASEAIGAERTLYAEDVHRTLITRHRRGIWSLLHRLALARGTDAFETPAGELQIHDGTRLECTLTLDERGYPTRLTYEEGGRAATLHYSDWQATDDLLYAASVREEPTGRSWKITRFQPERSFDPPHLDSK